ncbi:MAG: hypothetical protein IT558_02260 [Alphaproteobacteria bacterium]|nr:hypothetical protein [Alphaproteobacteria bacterium]
MFEDLFDLTKIRTTQQAIGFYIVYTVLMLVFLIALTSIMGVMGVLGQTSEQQYASGQSIGWVFVPGYCAVLSFLVTEDRDIKRPTVVVLCLTAMVFAMLSGFLGMLIPAYLTTDFRNKNK